MNSLEKKKKITILIPCYNEENGIRHVFNEIPNEELEHMGYATEVIVIDNNSTDKTAEICHELGIKVVYEGKKGKGNAMRSGFNVVSADTDIVVMIDGDNTYKPSEIPRLIEPIKNNFADVIVGSRLGGKTSKGALKFSNRVVNWGFCLLVRQFYRVNITDVLSGFLAWRKDVVDKLNLHLKSEGFSIEMEMITKMSKLGFEVYSVPITYDIRKGTTKISALKDGIIILNTWGRNIFWKPEIYK